MAASKKATLTEVLPAFSRDRLKELCRKLGIDDGGKEKAVLAERIIGNGTATQATVARAVVDETVEGPPASESTHSGPPSARPRAKTNGSATQKKGAGDLGFEATLWLAADKLRNNLDAAEYKHVVLGLIFLKYISDAYQERYKQLALESLWADDAPRVRRATERILSRLPREPVVVAPGPGRPRGVNGGALSGKARLGSRAVPVDGRAPTGVRIRHSWKPGLRPPGFHRRPGVTGGGDQPLCDQERT